MHNVTVKSRYSRVLPILNVIIGLTLLFSFLILARDIIAPRYKSIQKTVPSRKSDFPAARKSLQDFELILKSSPFGLSPAALIPLSSSREKTGSQTDITLIGTISGQQRYSFAIFTDSSGRQAVYKVGETIPGVGKLGRVDTDKVSIQGNGKLVDIPLADIVKIIEVSPGDGRQSEFARSMGGGTYIVDQKKVQQAIENPSQLMTDARLQPNFRNGNQEGFTLREVRGGGIYQSLGLQNGDVLLRINDYNISNPENALQAFTALRGMDRVQLDILRNDAKMTLTYQIR
ncbi:MAG: type II secretion system protein N [Thermodesulfovibrionales bacterium]|jgi:general secretion pathway protein C